MAAIILASCLFAAGGAFMKLSEGFTRLGPSTAVAVLFLCGAAVLARAMRVAGLATATIVGLGVEAIAAVALGMWLFSERLSNFQMAGLALLIGGTTLVRLTSA